MESEDVPQDAKPTCSTCHSEWKPTRRELVHATVVATVVAPLIALTTMQPVAASAEPLEPILK